MDPRSQLHIRDSRYLYPPSRNPYWKKIKDLDLAPVLMDGQTEEIPGKWRKKFSEIYGKHSLSETPLHLEIGCNGGHWLAAKAKQTPNELFLGMDWKFKQIYRAIARVKKHEIENTFFLRSHAERIKYVFGKNELDSVSVFFPDPWGKRSQNKNRFLTSEWIDEVSVVLKPGGTFLLKTDHEEYFDFFEQEVLKSKVNWHVIERTKNLWRDHPSPSKLEIPEVTLFEKIFIRDGIPTKLLRIQNPD